MALRRGQKMASFPAVTAHFIESLERRVLLSGGLIYVVNNGSGSGSSIGEYNATGSAVNASLVQGIGNPFGLAASGENLFVAEETQNSVAQIDLRTGTLENASFITGLNLPIGITASGSNLFVVNLVDSGPDGFVGEYTTAGATVNASLITGLTGPSCIAVSGSDLFVSNQNGSTISEYTTSGTLVNASLIAGLFDATGIVVSGSNLFVLDGSEETIGEYTTSGAVVNATLVSGLSAPQGLAISGSDLFEGNSGSNSIGEYTTTGAVVNASLVTGLNNPEGIVVVGTPTQVVFNQQPTNTVAASLVEPPVTVDVEDANGVLVANDTSSVTLSEASGPTGGFSGETNPAVNGVSNFDSLIEILKAGTYTLTASDGSLTPDTSTSFVVTPASPNQLAFTFAPANASAGVALTPAITVAVKDPYGNVITTNTSSVTLSIASGPGGGSLAGTTTQAASAGIATFTGLSLNFSGIYTLSATDGTLIADTSRSIDVSPGPATQLVLVSQPSSGAAGSVLAPAVVVNLEDTDGNIVTSDTSSVTVAISSGPAGATLGGTKTVAAIGGKATFNNLTLDKVGTYKLLATDGSLSSVTTSTFTVAPGPAAKLTISTPPPSVAAASIISPAIVVDVVDAGGNLSSSSTSSVTIAISSGPAGAVLGGTLTVSASNGVATFSDLSLKTVGNYTLKATDGSLTAAVSSSFNVSSTVMVGGPAQLNFGPIPGSATTGAVITPGITVDVDDANGLLVNTDTSTVTLSIASGPAGGALLGTLTVPAVAGIATFSNLTLTQAGNYTFNASDGALIPASSGSIAVTSTTPVGTTSLAFAQEPVSVAVGASLGTIVVNVVDGNGAVIPTDNSSVTLGITSNLNNVPLNGSTTVSAAGGVATFSGLSIGTAGYFTLTATDGTDTPGVSTTLIISAPPAAGSITFSNADFNGSWYVGQMDTSGTATFDGKGNITGGSLVHADGSTEVPTGTYSISPDGQVAVNGGSTGNTGAMNSSKDVVALNSPSQSNSLALITTGGNATFANSDLTGTWYTFFNGDSGQDNPAAGQYIDNTGHGIFTLDGNGNFNGTITEDESNTTKAVTGTYSVSATGAITITPSSGSNFVGQVDANKDLVSADVTDLPTAATNNDTRLLTLIQPIGTYSNADLSGAWTIRTDGGEGEVVFDGAGNATGSFVDSNGVGQGLTGTYQVASGGTFTLTVNVSSSSGGNKTMNFSGAINAEHNVAIMDQPNDGQKGEDDLVVLVQSSSTPIVAPVASIGGLDPTFGTMGIASHNVGLTSTAGLQSDGAQSVIIGTIGTSPNEMFGITRYNADGSVDNTFGTGGLATISFGSTDDVPSAVTVLASGNIIVSGTATTFSKGAATGSEFAIAELNPDGSLNAAFGTAGETLISFSSTTGTFSNDLLNGMAIGTDGTIYLAGSSDAAAAGNPQFAITALTPGGALNAGFASAGKLLLTIGGGDDSINSIALQKNGAIVVAGSATVGGISEIALARFLAAGKLDPHFGVAGIVTANVGGVYDSASSVALQTNGAIVIAGLTASGSGTSLTSNFVVQRYLTNGRLDRTFAGGTVVTPFGQPAAATQVVIQPNGEIVVSGKTTPSLANFVSSQLSVAVARYTTRGLLDTSFNGVGKTIINLSGSSATAAVATAINVVPLNVLAPASALSDEFTQFTHAQQGVVAITTGGEIIAAGNSGSNTVEAEVVSAGVNLVAKLLSTLPASILIGARGTATVMIKEIGTTQATGTVTLSLQLSNQGGTGPVTVYTLSTRINLRAGQSHSYRLNFIYSSKLASGSYQLLATTTDGPGLHELNPINNTAASSTDVKVAPPSISLSGTKLTAVSSLIPAKNDTITLDITNNGNVSAHGRITVDIFLSPDQTTADGIQIAAVPVVMGLPSGKSKLYSLRFNLAATQAAGNFSLLAILDPANSLGSDDKSDVTVIDSTAILVG